MGALPDPSWPVARQLEEAVATIKKNVKLILDSKAEVAAVKKVCQGFLPQIGQCFCLNLCVQC